MKKENIIALIMGIVGGIPFAIGMVMVLVTEWGMLSPGIVVGAIGLIILLAIYPVYRKVAHKNPIKMDRRTVASYVIGIVGTLLLGVGMCMSLLETSTSIMIGGMVIGIIGIVIDILNYPIYKISNNR